MTRPESGKGPDNRTSEGVISEAVHLTPREKDVLRTANQEHARQAIARMFQGSQIEDWASEYPRFDKSEIDIGVFLGKGEFGSVYECNSFRQCSLGDSESREFVVKHCLRDGQHCRYAIKMLSPKTLQDPDHFLKGIVVMAIETRVMSSLVHPHIVKLRAMAACDPFQTEYFIVMDRLYDTLEKRLTIWGEREKRGKKGLGKLRDRKGVKAGQLLEDRLKAAYGLASALEYMHERSILYRDLKPDNIGFDIRDDIRLFDFGLAKELHAKNRVSGPNKLELYKLSGFTGSPRYMSPEVANELPYNRSSDAYAFSILLWEVLSLKRPFKSHNIKTMQLKVWNGEHERPVLPAIWADPLRKLMQHCWSPDLSERYTMKHVTSLLHREVVRVRGGEEEGLHDPRRRRSTFVFKRTNKSAKAAARK